MVNEDLIASITQRVLAMTTAAPQVRGPCSAEQPGKQVSVDTCGSCGACATKRADEVRGLRAEGLDRIAHLAGADSPPQDLAPFIDHTLLKPEATKADLLKVCDEAKK